MERGGHLARFEVIGRSRVSPLLAAVQAGAVFGTRRKGIRLGGGCLGDLFSVRIVAVKRDGVAAPVRQHAVVPEVVSQIPDMRVRRTSRPGRGRNGSVVAGIGVDHVTVLFSA